jgi:putative DNA primase/helicase
MSQQITGLNTIERQPENTKINPEFDDSILRKSETFSNHFESLLNEVENPLHQHKDVLRNLIAELPPLEFVSSINPKAKNLIKEYNEIIEALKSGDKKLYKKLNEPKGNKETSRIMELESDLKSIEKGIKQKHYVVIIISEFLKEAEKRKLNLCQRYDYVYVYNGAYWKQLSKDDLKYFLGQAAITFGYSEIEAKHHQFKDELLKQFLTQSHLPTPEPDPNKILINLQNGTMEFINGKWKLKPFDPKDFLTYQLPFPYDPGATCPMFDNYLEKVLPDIDSRSILQEFSGFIFTKLNLEKCLVLTGGGSNGKSVFFNILTALIGKENTLTYVMGLFNQEYNRAKLTDVLLNYSSEKGTDLNVETFKALISGEPLQAREPYGKPFSITNKVKFIMNCNELPKETESTEAYFRRYIIIPFDVKISEAERDINLAEKIISEELAGVFNWLLVGLERLIKNKKFTESEKANNALSEFKRQADNIALFIDEFGYKPCSQRKKSLAELFGYYKNFCTENGYKAFGKNNFSNRIESKGFEPTRLNDGSKGFCLGVGETPGF